MKTVVTEQQKSFFTKNSAIEFALPHPYLKPAAERDLWRHDPALKTFLLKTVGRIALTLNGKPTLRLLCEQWILKSPAQPIALNKMFALQGIEMGVALTNSTEEIRKRSPLGLLPMPMPGHLLFFRPEILLDWPHVTQPVCLILFGSTQSVYVHNQQDPNGSYLKHLGYSYGDLLKNETHPVIS